MLIANHQLNNEQLTALDALCAACRIADGNVIPVYKNILSQQRDILCNILYYQEDQLVGFLSIYFFYEDACEVTLMVRPDYRRKGIALEMLSQALPMIRAEVKNTVIFSTVHTSESTCLKAKGLRYKSSDHEMIRSDHAPIVAKNSAIVHRSACPRDISALCVIDRVCFPDQDPTTSDRFLALLNDTNYSLFVACLGDNVIGKAHVGWQPHGAHFSDIAIIPDMQGRGFGQSLLTHCINHALAARKFNLSLLVEAKNKDALKLYQKLGFFISNACDYWAISVNALCRL